MQYIYLIFSLIAGFFIINGVGKLAIEAYVNNKLTFRATYFISWLSLLVWYIFSYGVLCTIAFNLNHIGGWVFAVIWGIGTLVVGIGQLGKDNRHSMDLAQERRVNKNKLANG